MKGFEKIFYQRIGGKTLYELNEDIYNSVSSLLFRIIYYEYLEDRSFTSNEFYDRLMNSLHKEFDKNVAVKITGNTSFIKFKIEFWNDYSDINTNLRQLVETSVEIIWDCAEEYESNFELGFLIEEIVDWINHNKE